jgi:hypothetical protein
VEVLHWLERLSSQLLQTRDAVRQRITADSDLLTVEVQRLRQELALANQKIEALTQENADFRKQLGLA